MEENLTGRKPQRKMTSQEDDITRTTSQEDNFYGRQPQWNTTSMEDDLNGRQLQWKTNSMEADLSGRQH